MSTRTEAELAWLPDLLSGLVMASGVGYLATAYTVSRWLTKPTPRRIQRTPTDYGMSWDPLECRTADGVRLTGWVVTPPRPRATVVLFHGIRNTREQTLERTCFLTAAGYRCVAFDHRAHGESPGKRSSFGYHESRDVIAIVDRVGKEWPRQPRVALGISMGAAALCFAARQTRPWDAVILESLYHDIASAFTNRIGTRYPTWFRKFSHGVVWVTERRLGLRLNQVAPCEHIAELAPAPVLLMTGSDDAHATPEDAQRLLERCREPRELWLVPGAGHRDVCETGGVAYQRRVLDFLERRLH